MKEGSMLAAKEKGLVRQEGKRICNARWRYSSI